MTVSWASSKDEWLNGNDVVTVACMVKDGYSHTENRPPPVVEGGIDRMMYPGGSYLHTGPHLPDNSARFP